MHDGSKEFLVTIDQSPWGFCFAMRDNIFKRLQFMLLQQERLFAGHLQNLKENKKCVDISKFS
jgi:hypothetical protein